MNHFMTFLVHWFTFLSITYPRTKFSRQPSDRSYRDESSPRRFAAFSALFHIISHFLLFALVSVSSSTLFSARFMQLSHSLAAKFLITRLSAHSNIFCPMLKLEEFETRERCFRRLLIFAK